MCTEAEMQEPKSNLGCSLTGQRAWTSTTCVNPKVPTKTSYIVVLAQGKDTAVQCSQITTQTKGVVCCLSPSTSSPLSMPTSMPSSFSSSSAPSASGNTSSAPTTVVNTPTTTTTAPTLIQPLSSGAPTTPISGSSSAPTLIPTSLGGFSSVPTSTSGPTFTGAPVLLRSTPTTQGPSQSSLASSPNAQVVWLAGGMSAMMVILVRE